MSNTICPHCGDMFVYEEQPETAMGACTCSRCGGPVTQADVVETRVSPLVQRVIGEASENRDDMLHGAPGGKPQRTITVEELFQKLEGILTFDALQSMWNAMRGNSNAVTKALKEHFAPHAATLEQRGYDGGYLAYMLPHVLGPHLEAQRRLGDGQHSSLN